MLRRDWEVAAVHRYLELKTYVSRICFFGVIVVLLIGGIRIGFFTCQGKRCSMFGVRDAI